MKNLIDITRQFLTEDDTSKVTPEMIDKAIQAIKVKGFISISIIVNALGLDNNKTALLVFQQIAAKLKMPMPENPMRPIKVNSKPTSTQSASQLDDKNKLINDVKTAQKELTKWANKNNAMKDPEILDVL